MFGVSVPYSETHDELYNFNNDLSSVIFGFPGQEKLKTSFNKLYNFLSKLEPVKLELFIYTNLQLLKHLSNEILFLIKGDPRAAKMDSKVLRSMYDKLFMKTIQLYKFPDNNFTLIFKEFIKGITYFKYQESGYIKDPVYHRLFSCGDGKHSFRTEFNRCNKTLMNKTKLKDVSMRIKTCFIERLIYQEMYLHNQFQLNIKSHLTKKTQDQGHTHWLEQTNGDFNTCYPELSIKIKIGYFNGLYPKSLQIRYFHKKKLIFVEEYIKTVGINNSVFYLEKVVYTKLTRNFSYSANLYYSKNPQQIKWKFFKKYLDNNLLFKLLERD
jgi:hypothetical protein